MWENVHDTLLSKVKKTLKIKKKAVFKIVYVISSQLH